jgi:hypothetical protein
VKAPEKSAFNLIVTGDVVVDHHIYEGERHIPAAENVRGVRAWRELGGAEAVHRLLVALFKAAGKTEAAEPVWHVHLGVTKPSVHGNPSGFHAFGAWRPFPHEKGKKDDKRKPVWRADRLMGYGQLQSAAPDDEKTGYEPKLAKNLPPPRILVLDDAGFRFRKQALRDCWLLPTEARKKPDWIFLKMTRPIAQGDLWHALSTRFSDRLVCLISADDLRQECVSISCGLSWERTVEEVRDVVTHSPVFAELKKCRHLIVRFKTDGALWVDRSEPGNPVVTLIYDAGGAEGGWESRFEGKVVGYSTAMIAALGYTLACHVSASAAAKTKGKKAKEPDIASAIKAGLTAARDLQEKGHGQIDEDPPTGFPVERLAETILKFKSPFAEISAPLPKPGDTSARNGTWTIIEMSQRPFGSSVQPSLVGLARQVVLQGVGAINGLPHASFGKLVSVDRTEIETLRSIRRQMLDYGAKKGAKKPLSIGVFGPPGAGKSFGVQQLSAEVFGKDAWLEFNLSQFGGAHDLIGAFHRVRDRVLSGETPVVFWDEFDSKNYEWLQYLLAPMQDGRFQDGQLSHNIGKCVFVFAGGTSHSFADFGELSPREKNETPEKEELLRLRKVPDFKSRLDAYYNVLGPNRRMLPPKGNAKPLPDPADVCYPLRRALLIRGLLGCAPEERLDFDSDLIDALLLAPNYEHGSRSLEKLVQQLRPSSGGPIRRSALPAAAQLAMHVDPKAFNDILNRNESFRMSERIEPLAKAIHEIWRALSEKEHWSMQKHLAKPYGDLAPIDKEDNRAAARRIPEVLAIAGLGIANTSQRGAKEEPPKKVVEDHIKHHVERLAEAEHDGWMEQRLKNGWRQGEPRNDELKIHPLLVRYAKLSEKEKNKDRNAVRHFPEMVAKAGYRIVWLKG